MQPHLSGGRRPLLPALQGLRLVAALHVLLVHSVQSQWLPGPLRSAIGAGYTSTSLLFFLSGFVLAYAYGRGDGRLTVTRREFWVARFSRVAPLLLVSHLLVLPLWVEAHGWGETWVPAALAFSGQQAWIPRYAHVLNTPAWAVTVFCLAYALFPALMRLAARIPARRLPAALAAAWLAALAPGVAYHLAYAPTAEGLRALFTFPLLRLPEFIVGVLAARWFLARGPLAPRAAAWWAGAGLAAWAVGIAFAARVPVALIHNGFFLPAQAAAVVGLACGGGAAGALLAWRPARALGERALALFLLHLPLLAWMQSLGWLPRPTLAASAAVYAAYVAVSLGLSVALSDAFADPAAAWLRRRFARPRRAAAPVELPVPVPPIA